jgi:hypothetical protein
VVTDHARSEEKGSIENREWKRRERVTDRKRGEDGNIKHRTRKKDNEKKKEWK